MARLLRESVNQSTPDITREQLVECLKSTRYEVCTDLRLSGIQTRHAIFTGIVYYRMTPQTRAKYDVTVPIALTDPMFNSDKLITSVYPSIAAPYAEFQFQNYVDNRGMGRSWIE